MPKRKCKSCGRKMKQQFIGVYHCKCGNTRMNGKDMERTSDTVFALEWKQVGKKVKQVPVVKNLCEQLAHQEYERELKMEQTLFAVYSDNSQQFSHRIKFKKKTKVSFRKSLIKEGYEVHYIFSRKEIDKVKSGEFVLNDVPLEVVTYLEQHLGEWDKYLDEIQVPKKKKRKK